MSGANPGSAASALSSEPKARQSTDPAVVERLLAEPVADQVQQRVGAGPTGRRRTSPRWPRARWPGPTSRSPPGGPRCRTPLERPHPRPPGDGGGPVVVDLAVVGEHPAPVGRRPSAGHRSDRGRPRPAGPVPKATRRRAPPRPEGVGPAVGEGGGHVLGPAAESAGATRWPGSKRPVMPHISSAHRGIGVDGDGEPARAPVRPDHGPIIRRTAGAVKDRAMARPSPTSATCGRSWPPGPVACLRRWSRSAEDRMNCATAQAEDFVRLPPGVRRQVLTGWAATRRGSRGSTSPLRPSAPGERTGPPDFVGIGVQKAGTTWWYQLILTHPGVERPGRHPQGAPLLRPVRRGPFGAGDVDRYHGWFPRPAGT